MILIITSIAIILSAILYRLGGAKGWHTKYRDFGCPLVALGLIMFFKIIAPWYIHAIAALLMFGALTTYWDKLFKYDNFYMHGLMIGLAYLPYLMVVAWWLILIRTIILCLFMGLLNWGIHKTQINRKDIVEECGRGAIIITTLPLFLI